MSENVMPTPSQTTGEIERYEHDVKPYIVDASERSKRAMKLKKVLVYSLDPVPDLEEVTRILKYGDEEMLNHRWYPVLLPPDVRHASFLVKYSAWNRSTAARARDAYGKWGKQSGFTVYYNVDEYAHTIERLNTGRNGRYSIPERYGYRLVRLRAKHSQEPLFMRTVFYLHPSDGACTKVLVHYHWKCQPYELARAMTPRGSSGEKVPAVSNVYRVPDDDVGEIEDSIDDDSATMIVEPTSRSNGCDREMMSSGVGHVKLEDLSNTTPSAPALLMMMDFTGNWWCRAWNQLEWQPYLNLTYEPPLPSIEWQQPACLTNESALSNMEWQSYLDAKHEMTQQNVEQQQQQSVSPMSESALPSMQWQPYMGQAGDFPMLYNYAPTYDLSTTACEMNSTMCTGEPYSTPAPPSV